MDFRILGPLQVAEGDVTLTLPGGKPRALLAVLLLHPNQVLSRDQLIDHLWGEEPPDTASNTLQVHVSQLRRVLCPGDARRARELVRTEPPGYALRVEPGELDLERFERQVARAREARAAGDPARAASLLAAALSLWRGPPLPELAQEPFAQPELARLEEARLAALDERFEVELELGRHRALVAELEAVVAAHPLRERPRAQLMKALYRSDRQAEALRVYQETRRTLVDELGLEPSEALQQLHRAILVHDPALDSPASAERVEPAAPPRQVRKTVTVVVVEAADAGSGDPESHRPRLEQFFTTAEAVVAGHGGRAQRLPGDMLLAAFGLPASSEDDALRAVAAASELRRRAATDLDVRVGVATGEVLVREPYESADLVGPLPTVGVRLAHAAAAGEILLAEGTRQLVPDAVELEPIEAGRTRTESWRLTNLQPGAAAFARRLDTELVGREHELAVLLRAFDWSVRERRAYLQTVVGPAGIGKSRLARELATAVADRAQVLVGRCLSYGAGITLWPLAEILRQLDGDQGAGGIASHLGGADDAEAVASSLAAAVGLQPGASPADEVASGTRKLFESLARNRPLVVVFDDVHWAEPAFLDVVEHLRDWTQDAPVTLVCLSRPDLLETRPGWGTPRSNAGSLFLAPLTDGEAAALIDRLATGRTLSDAERTTISSAAEGNPLFIEQMLAALIDGDATPSAAPPTLQTLVAARLDALDWQERTVLEVASVIGKDFAVAAVQALVPEPLGEDCARHVQALLAKELIRTGTGGDEGALRFHHGLIRDVTYESIVKERRAELHELLGNWLEARADGAGYEELVGYHFEQAHRYRKELGLRGGRALAVKGGGHLATAGYQAHARGDLAATCGLFTRASALLPADDSSRLELLPDLADALRETGEFSRAEAVLDEAVRRARTAGQDAIECHARVVGARIQLQVNPDVTADALLADVETSIRLFDDLGDERGLARAWAMLSWVPWVRGRVADAEAALQHAIRHAGAAGDLRTEAQSLNLFLGAALFGPLPVAEGIRRCYRILHRHATTRRVTASAFRALAVLRAMQGRFDQARDFLERDRQILRDLGLTVVLASASEPAAMVELLAGEPAAAERELRQGYDVLEQLGEKGAFSGLAALLARAAVAQGKDDDALEFTKVTEGAAVPDDMTAHIQWRGVRAIVLARQGRHEPAERFARDAVALAAGTDLLNFHADALLDLAEVLRIARRKPAARAAVTQAMSLFEAKGNIVQSARAGVSLKALGSRAKPADGLRAAG